MTHATEEEKRLARERYCADSDDDIEVDDNAAVSRGEDGAWVSGWLFVPKHLIPGYVTG